ncbi:MAG: hypothetical protein D3911_13470 [Candidatus Electrothrix sp. AW3_4]|nr:hypothetical protein [Candidatus Electrothrix gigas]
MDDHLLAILGAAGSLLTCLVTGFICFLTYKNYQILTNGLIDFLFIKNGSNIYIHIYNNSQIPITILYVDDVLWSKITGRKLAEKILLNQPVLANSSEPTCVPIPDRYLKKPFFIEGEYRPSLELAYSFDNIKKKKIMINRI